MTFDVSFCLPPEKWRHQFPSSPESKGKADLQSKKKELWEEAGITWLPEVNRHVWAAINHPLYFLPTQGWEEAD